MEKCSEIISLVSHNIPTLWYYKMMQWEYFNLLYPKNYFYLLHLSFASIKWKVVKTVGVFKKSIFQSGFVPLYPVLLARRFSVRALRKSLFRAPPWQCERSEYLSTQRPCASNTTKNRTCNLLLPLRRSISLLQFWLKLPHVVAYDRCR